MSKTMTVEDFRAKVPGFFSKSNRKFYGDTAYSVWKGMLIVKTTKKLSVGSYTSFVAYRYKDEDTFWVASASTREMIRLKINTVIAQNVDAEYDVTNKPWSD